MNALEVFRLSHRRRRMVELVATFVMVLSVAVAVIGLLTANARAGFGCASRAITVSSSDCGASDPGPAVNTPAEVRIVFESDSTDTVQAQR